MKLLIALFITLFIFSIAVSAQSTAFTYQGRLTDASMPQGNGSYTMKFRLYDASENGNQAGSEQTALVTVNNGIFATTLDFTAEPFSSGQLRFLEIQVEGTTLSPRVRLSSVPYAIRSITAGTANNAMSLGGVAANQFVQTNDSRLSDARQPLAGSSNYIQNTIGQQASANFNISGNGSVGGTLTGTFINTWTGYKIDGNHFISKPNSNIFVGSTAGQANTTGDFNTIMGRTAGYYNTTGSYNTFVGIGAGATNNTGNSNSFFGIDAGGGNFNGFNNSFFGMSAGSRNRSGNNNTVIGSNANVDAVATNLSFATAIGADAIVSTSNTIVLGRSDGSDKVRIFGLGTGGYLALCRNSAYEISTCSPQMTLAENNNQTAETINTLREQVKQQQQQIDALIRLVCSQNTKADVCKQK